MKIITITLLISLLLTGRVIAGEEACRIRIYNEVGGLVQVSLDGGTKWGTVGRVTGVANARIAGFAAASYVPHGTIAATAVHGIRIKTGQYALGIGKAQKAMLFSIEPLEFAKIPNGYGGHRPRSSGIYTDIYAGHSIFRNFSPYVGNSVFIEQNHSLLPVPEDYTPREGETFVIIVTQPEKPISEIDFENKTQGKVMVKYSDDSSQVIASVDRPVKGIGRYDGTTFTGVGAVNTNHGGVLTISTAPTCLPRTPEGDGEETRGGFMIQPYYHVMEQQEANPQVMVVGPSDSKTPHMEGTPPLFFGNINLTRIWGHPEYSYRTQVKIDDGEWEDVPQVIGKIDDAFTGPYLESYFSAKGKPRKVTQGVTAIRLLFPKLDPALLKRDLNQEISEYNARAPIDGIPVVKGTTALKPAKALNGQYLVSYYIDGLLDYMSSCDPYYCAWDTTKVSNGLHVIQTEITAGSVTTVEKRVVMVKN